MKRSRSSDVPQAAEIISQTKIPAGTLVYLPFCFDPTDLSAKDLPSRLQATNVLQLALSCEPCRKLSIRPETSGKILHLAEFKLLCPVQLVNITSGTSFSTARALSDQFGCQGWFAGKGVIGPSIIDSFAENEPAVPNPGTSPDESKASQLSKSEKPRPLSADMENYTSIDRIVLRRPAELLVLTDDDKQPKKSQMFITDMFRKLTVDDHKTESVVMSHARALPSSDNPFLP